MQPLTLICITTYNRCEYLQKSIETIVIQNEFKAGKIEIIISDHASTDITKEKCEKYARRYENIHYFRNIENILTRIFRFTYHVLVEF